MDKAKIAQKQPYSLTLEAGKTYAWCACGRSDNQPFCDGSHKVTDIKPKLFRAHDTKQVFLCGCKQTSNPPYCDGTHKKL